MLIVRISQFDKKTGLCVSTNTIPTNNIIDALDLIKCIDQKMLKENHSFSYSITEID